MVDTMNPVDLPVLGGTDHVELYVGNARQAAYHYRNAFGFDVIAYAGPETGVRDRASYVLQQGKVRLVLTAPPGPDGDVADHARRHGDGVKAIALRDEAGTGTPSCGLRPWVARGPRSMSTFPVTGRAVGLKPSQIQEYLDHYRGCGVQHIAVQADDIVGTVAAMRDRGVEFLSTPGAYYDALGPRAEGIDEDLDRLCDLRILIDRDDDGYLLQIFTRPVGDRPTLFFEVIQRKGCKGFGKGNFKALFEAIEREQAARGNL